MSESAPSVVVEVRDGIATLTLNRPEARNALGAELTAALHDALAEVGDRAGEEVKALVLTGAGPAFCAGGDIKAMRARGAETPAAQRARMRRAHRMLTRLATLDLPTIAAVNGAAAGAGCNLALTCDFVLAAESAVFVQSFVRIGLVPDYGGIFALPRIIGLQRAKELMFTGRPVGAAEARDLGMVHSVHPDEGLLAAAHAFAGRFRHASTFAIATAKAMLARTFSLDYATALEMEVQAQGEARATSYHAECIERFVAKEPLPFDWARLDREEGS